MKKMFCLLLFCFLFLVTIGQSRVGESRRTILPHAFQEYNPPTALGRFLAGVPVNQDIPSGSKFTIVDETTMPNDYIIFFWVWNKSATKRTSFNYEAGSTTAIKYFIIPKNQLDVVTEKIYRRWSPSVGVLTFPFKYRPQSGKFETTFNIGGAGGVTWNPFRTNEHTFSLLFGIAASTARVDKYNTDPAANITDASDRASVTFSLNFLYQWERLQIGISGGLDNLLDNEILKWKYQGKGWLSFGVGISLFSASEIKSPGKN